MGFQWCAHQAASLRRPSNASPADVTEIPANGTWFQLIANGTTQINTGANGLARLDKIVELAQANGIYLILSLTNNWNPLPGDDTTQVPAVSRRDSITGNNLTRNYLSNDYGGMDAYVREFGTTKDHSEFYTSSTIISTFNSYITTVVERYINSPAIMAWEIANDPRYARIAHERMQLIRLTLPL